MICQILLDVLNIGLCEYFVQNMNLLDLLRLRLLLLLVASVFSSILVFFFSPITSFAKIEKSEMLFFYRDKITWNSHIRQMADSLAQFNMHALTVSSTNTVSGRVAHTHHTHTQLHTHYPHIPDGHTRHAITRNVYCTTHGRAAHTHMTSY